MSSDPGVQLTGADYADERQYARVLSRRHLWLLFVAVVTAVLCAPFLHALFGAGGDEGVLLNGAERMLKGERLYVDFFEFLPPGGFILTEAWFSIVGISFVSARSLAILTIVGIACFTYLTCRQASNSAPLSAALALGWRFLGLPCRRRV